MNRKIKFRAWAKNKMHHFDLSDTIVPSLEDNVMQFTGLKDRNGVEIYEGDILESLHFTDAESKDYFLYHRVVWSEKYNGWQAVEMSQNGNEPNGNPQLFVYIKNCIFKVFGNIYETEKLKTGF